ncbi:diaminopimelate epimerase [Jeotgalibacillus proteolyticus]|uniref:diaminopimelate epimerase n=1 Tax=Jeotgalibacillus proteolyticus TaxID=2082395 RepID=UPI003CF97D78
MKISVMKSHGSKNDFIIIDEQERLVLNDDQRASLAVHLCDRSNSIGGDGILYITESRTAQAKMRVFNSDGSEASMCGNGLRCAARYIAERDEVQKFKVETMKADLTVEKVESLYEDIPTYAVEISPILFQLDSLPLQLDQETLFNQVVPEWHETLRFSALAVPNPHLITQVTEEQLLSGLQQKLAQSLNSPNQWFTDGVNVSFVVPLEPNQIFVRTYERGVGFTNACGTAMSSSSLIQVMLEQGEAGIPIDVYNDGGRVKCVIHRKDDQFHHIDLIGNATFTDEYTLEFSENEIIPAVQHVKSTGEELIYQRMAEASREFVTGHLPGLDK